MLLSRRIVRRFLAHEGHGLSVHFGSERDPSGDLILVANVEGCIHPEVGEHEGDADILELFLQERWLKRFVRTLRKAAGEIQAALEELGLDVAVPVLHDEHTLTPRVQAHETGVALSIQVRVPGADPALTERALGLLESLKGSLPS